MCGHQFDDFTKVIKSIWCCQSYRHCGGRINWAFCMVVWSVGTYGIDLNWCVLSLSEKSWITKHALWTNVSLFRSFFTICIDRLQTINYHKSVHIESNIICSHKKKIGAFLSLSPCLCLFSHLILSVFAFRVFFSI